VKKLIILLALGGLTAHGQELSTSQSTRIKDIATIRGARSNQLTGLGIVVGLEGTGDTKATPQLQQAIANLMRKAGIQVEPAQMSLKNSAIVYVTGELPPFAQPGTRIDVNVSSLGDAKSLQGGTLLQTPLFGAASQEIAYAVAAGPLSIGGFNFSAGGSSVQKNHVTAGRIPDGAIVEHAVDSEFLTNKQLFIQLMKSDFTTANNVVESINKAYPDYAVRALDSATIRISAPDVKMFDPVRFVSELELLPVKVDVPAVIVVNERTGTIVIGENVRLRPAAIAHGGISVTITKTNTVSQPPPLTGNNGTALPVENTEVKVKESPARIAFLDGMPTVADVVKALNLLGVTPRDLISILQALRQAGALQAQIEVQ
jgi:flagellar P-ring protein precursor FlgI